MKKVIDAIINDNKFSVKQMLVQAFEEKIETRLQETKKEVAQNFFSKQNENRQ